MPLLWPFSISFLLRHLLFRFVQKPPCPVWWVIVEQENVHCSLKILCSSSPFSNTQCSWKLCSACVLGGFPGPKFGRRDGGVRDREWSGISSGLSLAAAWLSISITVNSKHSLVWMFLKAPMLPPGTGRTVVFFQCLRLCLRLCNCSHGQFGVGVEIVQVWEFFC